MEKDNTARARAERSFRPDEGRNEKGSALNIIAAETKAVDDKTARLKALRLERDSGIVPEAPKPARRKAAKPAVRR